MISTVTTVSAAKTAMTISAAASLLMMILLWCVSAGLTEMGPWIFKTSSLLAVTQWLPCDRDGTVTATPIPCPDAELGLSADVSIRSRGVSSLR